MKNIQKYPEYVITLESNEPYSDTDANTEKLFSILSDTETFYGIEDIRNLIEQGVDLEKKKWYGMNLLHLATLNGNLEAMKLLVKAGADITEKTEADVSPMQIACYFGKTELVKYLLELGLGCESQLGKESPLCFAAMRNNKETVKLLLLFGCDPSDCFASFQELSDFFDGDLGWAPQSVKRTLMARDFSSRAFGV